jgi:hypothetical protein
MISTAKEKEMTKQAFSFLCALALIGCAKPTAPESLAPGTGGYTIVARLQMPGYAQDVDMNDTLAYVAEGEGGVAVVSVANPSAPRLLSVCYLGVRGYSYKIARRDSIVYLATGGFGINTVNVGNAYSPTFIAHYGGASSTNDVAIFDGWLLEAKGEAGIRFANIAEVDPGYIDARGSIITPGFARGMVALPDSSLLVACGEMGFAIFDLRDIERVQGFYTQEKQSVAWIDLPGYVSHLATMGDQRIAFLACGTAGVQVVDFSDTTNLRVIGSYSTGGYAKEVAYSNGRLYVTTELRGLQILSVTNPSAPTLIGVVETKYALGVAVDQRYVYVADQTEGLIIVKIPT